MAKRKKKQKQTPKVGYGGTVREIVKYGEGAIHSYRDDAANAVQWLLDKGKLKPLVIGQPTDELMAESWSDVLSRLTVAQQLESLFDAAELSPVKSPDWESVPGGGFGPKNVPIRKIIAMRKVQELRHEMPPMLMSLIEQLIRENCHLWHGVQKSKQQRIFQDIRFALDFSEWALNKIERGEAGSRATENDRVALCKKWPLAEDWFQRKRLLPFLHAGKVIR